VPNLSPTLLITVDFPYMLSCVNASNKVGKSVFLYTHHRVCRLFCHCTLSAANSVKCTRPKYNTEITNAIIIGALQRRSALHLPSSVCNSVATTDCNGCENFPIVGCLWSGVGLWVSASFRQ